MFGDLMGNFQQQQEELAKKLDKITVDAQAGDGAVKITATANRTITNISIDPSKLDLTDAEELEDLLMVAVNRALENAAAKEAEESQSLLSNMLPPGMGNLFGG